MSGTELYWVDAPWSGKLALAARPRSADWLPDEIAAWDRAGIDTVFSLLTSEEERELGIALEASEATSQGLKFISFPIVDRGVPMSESGFSGALEQPETELSVGRNVVLHCRQGIGRTGLVAAALLTLAGRDVETAIRQISSARGIPVPETAEQRRWIETFARHLPVPDERCASAEAPAQGIAAQFGETGHYRQGLNRGPHSVARFWSTQLAENTSGWNNPRRASSDLYLTATKSKC